MNNNLPQPATLKQHVIARTLAILILVLLMIAIGSVFLFYPAGAVSSAPEQPIPFSHRVHVTDKNISCLLCHSGVVNKDHAGIPPLETCILCHSKIIIHQPQIAKLRKHFDDRIPVEWVRIAYVPDFVFFSHQAHIQAGFDCGKCHGDIAHMDRVVRPTELQMGFCVQCHRDQNASHDCLRCHR